MSRILQALQAHSTSQADQTAIIGDKQSLSWAQLQAQVVSLSEQLQETRTLGLLMQNDPAWVVTDLAALPDGTILCFYERGSTDGNSIYRTGRLTVARFDEEWVRAGD